jgi:hypothetical protein
MLPRSAFRLSCALLAAVLVGCSDDDSGPSGPQTLELDVQPQFRGVLEGDTVRLTATLNGAPATVTWESSNTAVATVSAQGLVTGLTGGFAAITASTAGPSRMRSSSITVIAVPALTSGTGVTIASSGARGTSLYRKITVPAGATSLTVTISGGSGDVDLYIRRGAVPTFTTYDCASEAGGNAESCVISNPAAGTYFIMLGLWDPYANATLRATVAP